MVTQVEVYDGTAAFLRSLELDDDALTKAIIGTIGDVDSYQLPDAKGHTALLRHVLRVSDAERQLRRDQILATTAQDFRCARARQCPNSDSTLTCMHRPSNPSICSSSPGTFAGVPSSDQCHFREAEHACASAGTLQSMWSACRTPSAPASWPLPRPSAPPLCRRSSLVSLTPCTMFSDSTDRVCACFMVACKITVAGTWLSMLAFVKHAHLRFRARWLCDCYKGMVVASWCALFAGSA